MTRAWRENILHGVALIPFLQTRVMPRRSNHDAVTQLTELTRLSERSFEEDEEGYDSRDEDPSHFTVQTKDLQKKDARADDVTTAWGAREDLRKMMPALKTPSGVMKLWRTRAGEWVPQVPASLIKLIADKYADPTRVVMPNAWDVQKFEEADALEDCLGGDNVSNFMAREIPNLPVFNDDDEEVIRWKQHLQSHGKRVPGSGAPRPRDDFGGKDGADDLGQEDDRRSYQSHRSRRSRSSRSSGHARDDWRSAHAHRSRRQDEPHRHRRRHHREEEHSRHHTRRYDRDEEDTRSIASHNSRMEDDLLAMISNKHRKRRGAEKEEEEEERTRIYDTRRDGSRRHRDDRDSVLSFRSGRSSEVRAWDFDARDMLHRDIFLPPSQGGARTQSLPFRDPRYRPDAPLPTRREDVVDEEDGTFEHGYDSYRPKHDISKDMQLNLDLWGLEQLEVYGVDTSDIEVGKTESSIIRARLLTVSQRHEIKDLIKMAQQIIVIGSVGVQYAMFAVFKMDMSDWVNTVAENVNEEHMRPHLYKIAYAWFGRGTRNHWVHLISMVTGTFITSLGQPVKNAVTGKTGATWKDVMQSTAKIANKYGLVKRFMKSMSIAKKEEEMPADAFDKIGNRKFTAAHKRKTTRDHDMYTDAPVDDPTETNPDAVAEHFEGPAARVSQARLASDEAEEEEEEDEDDDFL
jgi:hypothetical protein